MKKYYSEYIRHCLRFYVMTLESVHKPSFVRESDKENWMACHSIMSHLPPEQVEKVKYLYRPGSALTDNIYMLSANEKDRRSLWEMIENLEKSIAKRRGLL